MAELDLHPPVISQSVLDTFRGSFAYSHNLDPFLYVLFTKLSAE